MNRVLILLLISLVLHSCEKDESCNTSFTPTDINIGKMGPGMFFGIQIPSGDSYGFSADSTILTAIGDQYHEYLIQKVEMEKLAKDLSDILIFRWESTTAVSPYPADECELHVGQPGFGAYMCSIGKGKVASCIIQELSKSMSGDAKYAFAEIVDYLSN